jgi:hypothetical protein
MIMKKFGIKFNTAKYILTAMFAMSIFSCQDSLLDPVAKTQIPSDKIFNSVDRVGLLVNGMYTLVKNGNVLGGRAQIYGDVRANDFLNRTSNGVTAYLVWQQTLTESSQNDVINLWNNAYAAINDINLVIDGLQDPENVAKFVVPNFPATFLDAGGLRDQYVAEGKFVRAVTYYTMLQFYAQPFNKDNGASPGLPLRLTGQTGLDDNLLARSTVAEVYAQILKDLDEAEAALPSTYGSATLRTTRAHKNAAIAFKTRVYLTMGNYAKVITEANKIVPLNAPFVASSGIAHALQGKIVDTFAPPQETTEWILGFPFTAQNTPGTQNQLAFYFRSSSTSATANPVGYQTPGGGEFSLNSGTGSIVADAANWPTDDARRQAWVYKVGSENFLGKYPSGNPYIDKAPLMRWSEVLLNLSEALARTNGGVDARSLALLNAVRLRATGTYDHDSNPTTLEIPDPHPYAPADNATLIANIMNERRIEFLGEGLRSTDIMRLLQPFPAKGAVPAVATTAPQYIWPIPITERAVNTACVPN